MFQSLTGQTYLLPASVEPLSAAAWTAPADLLSPSEGFVPFDDGDIEQTIARRFESQVERHPDRIAVKAGEVIWNYRELNRRANRIARAILNQCGPGNEPIALLLDKGPWLLAATLGVLKAGKIYVPLSPTAPAVRNGLILEDARAELLLSDRGNAGNGCEARALAGTCPVCAAEDFGLGLDESNLDLDLSADLHAYIIYTSGTSGRPKGVVDTHRNLLHNIRKFTNTHYIGPHDRLAGVNAAHFSNILKDIYGAVLNGGTFLPLDLEKEGLLGTAKWLRRERITILSVVASVFRHFVLTLPDDERFPDMRLVRLGGEAVTRMEMELFRRHFGPDCVLVNGYGTTETGTVSVMFMGHETSVEGHVLPVGYEAQGMEVRLLDEHGREVELGKVGEITVRSEFLSPGYWKRPDLTAAAFRPDTVGGNRRTYLTGDLGRQRADGCLEYLGRKDFQVKVHGNRVEVAEVEVALREIPGVQDAVVVQREELPEDACLVAYVVPSLPAQVPDARILRAALNLRLPSYAIPSAFVPIGVLPFTSTGKLDRRALPAPPVVDRGFVAPRTDVERRLASLWQTILGVRQVGVKDDFFDLGGNSLLAASLMVKIHQQFAASLPLSTLLEATTVERLAELIRPGSGVPDSSALVVIQPHGSRRPFFCVHAVGGEVLSYAALARHLGPDQPFYAFQARGLYSDVEPLSRIEDMAAHYVDELCRKQPDGPYYLGGYSMGGIVAYEMAQQLLQRGADVALLAIIDQRCLNPQQECHGGLAVLGRLLRNAPRWLRDDLLRSSPRKLLGRIRVHVAKLCRRLSGFFSRSAKRSCEPNVADLFDLSGVPDRHRRFLQMNYRALRNYVAKPYFGRVALFQARVQPLLRLQNAKMGWKPLVLGELDWREVPGTHDSVIDEPHVQTLARELRTSLDRAGAGAPIGLRSRGKSNIPVGEASR